MDQGSQGAGEGNSQRASPCPSASKLGNARLGRLSSFLGAAAACAEGAARTDAFCMLTPLFSASALLTFRLERLEVTSLTVAVAIADAHSGALDDVCCSGRAEAASASFAEVKSQRRSRFLKHPALGLGWFWLCCGSVQFRDDSFIFSVKNEPVPGLALQPHVHTSRKHRLRDQLCPQDTRLSDTVPWSRQGGRRGAQPQPSLPRKQLPQWHSPMTYPHVLLGLRERVGSCASPH
jgi:hypothetical protein